MLSNKEKRAQYDLYGAEGPRRRNSQYGDQFSEYDYARGFEGMIHLIFATVLKNRNYMLLQRFETWFHGTINVDFNKHVAVRLETESKMSVCHNGFVLIYFIPIMSSTKMRFILYRRQW